MGKSWYSVSIDTNADEPTGDRLEALLEALEAEGAVGAVTGGGDRRWSTGPSATLSVEAAGPEAAAGAATKIFGRAAKRAGIRLQSFERVDVSTEGYLERSIENNEPERFVGVAEIAELLGISKQRVSQLPEIDGFPAPVANLKSGPVWRMSNLQRFIDEWPRKPGRPRRDPVEVS